MEHHRKTVIVTGASQGIGAGVVKAFLARGCNVVGIARSATKSNELSPSDHLALVDGDIGQFETAQKVAEVAMDRFGSIDAVVANAGIFIVKPFTDYTADDFRALVSTNLAGFIYITQLAVKQMQAQKTGGSIVSITAALVDNPIAGEPASLSMITKGGVAAGLRSRLWNTRKSTFDSMQWLPASSPRLSRRIIRKSIWNPDHPWGQFRRLKTLPARWFF